MFTKIFEKVSVKYLKKPQIFLKITVIFFWKTCKVSNLFKRCLKTLKNLKMLQIFSKNSNNRKKTQEYLKINLKFPTKLGNFYKNLENWQIV
jgi:hypothetical protein